MKHYDRLVAIAAATIVWVFLLSPHFVRLHSHWLHFTGFGRALIAVYGASVFVLIVSLVWLGMRKDFILAGFVAFTVIVAVIQYPKIQRFREVNMKKVEAIGVW